MTPPEKMQPAPSQFPDRDEDERRGGAAVPPLARLPVAKIALQSFHHPLVEALSQALATKFGVALLVSGTLVVSSGAGMMLRYRELRQEHLEKSHKKLKTIFSNVSAGAGLIRSDGRPADGMAYVTGVAPSSSGEQGPSAAAQGGATGSASPGAAASDPQAVAAAAQAQVAGAGGEADGGNGAGGGSSGKAGNPSLLAQARLAPGRGLSEMDSMAGGNRPQGAAVGSTREFSEGSIKAQTVNAAPAKGRAYGSAAMGTVRGRSVNSATGGYLQNSMAPAFNANKGANATTQTQVQTSQWSNGNTPNQQITGGGGVPLAGENVNSGATATPPPSSDAGEGGPIAYNPAPKPLPKAPPPSGPDLSIWKSLIFAGKALVALGLVLSIASRFQPALKSAGIMVATMIMGIGAAIVFGGYALQGMLFLVAGASILASMLMLKTAGSPVKSLVQQGAKDAAKDAVKDGAEQAAKKVALTGAQKFTNAISLSLAIPALGAFSKQSPVAHLIENTLGVSELAPVDRSIQQKMGQFTNWMENT